MLRYVALRRFRLVLVAAMLSLVLVVPPAAAQGDTKGPIRVGILLPYTGVFALYGPAMTQTIEAYVKQIGGKVGDRPIEIVREDDEGKPDVGLTKTKKLVERDRVHVIVGPVSSAVALAIRDYLHAHKIPLVIPIAFSKELTAPEKASPFIFRVIDTTDQNGYTFGQWAAQKKGFKRMAVIGANYAAGRDGAGAFKAGFEAAGGKVVNEIFPTLGTTDFSPYISRIEPSQVDAAYAVVFGSDAIRLVKQWEEYGFKGKVPLLGYSTTLDDNLLGPMSTAALGHLSISPYSATADFAENREFVKLINATQQTDPVLFHATAWVSMQLITKAVSNLKGDLSNPEQVAQALKTAGDGLSTPMGKIRFDQYNQIVPPLYVREVRQVSGKIKNVGIDELPPVAQEAVWGWWRKK